MIKTFLPLFAIFLLSSFPAVGCEEGFDDTPPSAKSGTTGSTDKTHFEWGSDIDLYGNDDIEERAWHIIRNIHDQNLSLNWVKPGLLIPFNSPLSPGDCRSAHDYGKEGAFELDHEAPIITSNDGEKNAVAYVKADKPTSKESPRITGAGIRADYRTEDGERATAITRLIVYYFPEDQIMQLNVYTGETGESIAFHPESLGLNVDKVKARLSASNVKNLESSPLDEMVEFDELSEQAFNEIENENFIRISTKEPLILKFGEVFEIPSEQTSILLFSPQGSLLLAKRLIVSMLSESGN